MCKHLVILLASAIVFPGLTVPAGACTTFCADGPSGPVFGKNYDWSVDDGMVLVNKRGVTKTGMSPERPARWTSRFGSVTFNQYGREMPCGGINEAGLVVELMWLDSTEYPAADDRPSLSNLQWVQYHLDVSATVDDVIAGDADVRISGESQARVHFLVADRLGATATVEFLDGRMVAHRGDSLPYPVLTNHPYETSLEYLSAHAGFGGDRPPGGTDKSLDRFVRAVRGVRDFDRAAAERAVDAAFDILSAVSQGASTKWSIVYDLGAMRVYFRTFNNPLVRFADVGGFDFACDSPVRMLDIDADVDGDAGPHFEPYTTAANLRLVKSAFARTDFLQDTPANVLALLAGYPETTECNR